MSGSFIKAALSQASVNNDAVRIELRKARHLKARIAQAASANAAFLSHERAVGSEPAAVRSFLDREVGHPIVHAMWDDPDGKAGIGTRLLKGEGYIYDRLVRGPACEKPLEVTVRVPDEEAARWIQWICGGPFAAFESNAHPPPLGEAYLAMCVDRPQPDGTTIRETIRVDVPE